MRISCGLPCIVLRIASPAINLLSHAASFKIPRPLSHKINDLIPHSVFDTFCMVLGRRICLNVKVQ